MHTYTDTQRDTRVYAYLLKREVYVHFETQWIRVDARYMSTRTHTHEDTYIETHTSTPCDIHRLI